MAKAVDRKKQNRLLLIIVAVILVVTLATAAVLFALNYVDSGVYPESSATPKNVILLIGDGMGENHIEAGNIYRSNKLNMERFGVIGEVMTRSLTPGATDSAAAATAMATGVKTYNGRISYKDGKNLETIAEMARLMEENPHAGIIQASPQMINATSMFAREQQFAGRIAGPVVGAGLAYWQAGNSNYWGHNAIIRTRAFIECCGLPKLKGKGPFGGFILSHDFVEAALIARGGWSAWLLPELKGSYEECPPSMIDFAARDRRWCQGNLQHIKVLVSRGLHPVSRVHFLTGIMSYLSSPLWLLFLLAGLSMVLFREFVPPQYFGQTYSLFPEWPVFDKAGTIWLFVLSMAMLLVPKFLGLAVFLRQNRRRQKAGKPGLSVAKTAGGLGLEIVVSTLMAPVMMLFQSKFVFDILCGKSVSWNAQNRGDDGTSWRTAWRVHKWHTILGAVTAAAVWKYAHVLFWWLSPITLGLVLAAPLSVFTSRVSVGQWLKTRGWFLIPEEVEKPTVAQRASFWFSELAPFEAGQGGWQMLQQDEMLRRLHRRMLPVNGPAPEFAPEVAEAAAEKVARGEKLEREEEMYLLYKR